MRHVKNQTKNYNVFLIKTNVMRHRTRFTTPLQAASETAAYKRSEVRPTLHALCPLRGKSCQRP
jgi:hypothetical protein